VAEVEVEALEAVVMVLEVAEAEAVVS